MDLAAILENNFLSIIRTTSVFFVAGIALFNFTNLGKSFSLISLLAAFILLFSILLDYFIERSRISKLGFYPRSLIDILAFILIGILILFIWIFYNVWITEPTSIGDLAKEVESEIQKANRELIESIKDVNEKILSTNQNLITHIKGKGFSEDLSTKKLGTNIAKFGMEQQQSTVNNATLAGVIS